jgi:hypothetical protein
MIILSQFDACQSNTKVVVAHKGACSNTKEKQDEQDQEDEQDAKDVEDGTRKGAVLIAREAQGGEEEKPAIGMKNIFASTRMTFDHIDAQGLKIQREGP